MTSAVELVNNALIFLGQPLIQSLEQTTPPAAVFAATLYQSTLDEVLRAHPWNFAIDRVELAPLAAAPAYGYQFTFQRPADWLRTLETSAPDFRHEGKRILANVSSLQLRYVRRVTDLTEWDALAAAAAARNLAAKLAYPLTKSNTVQEAQWQMYVAILKQAKGVDAQEEPAEEFEQSSLLTVRR